MKISCLIGSPRKNSNSAAIAAKFTETATGLGAQVETVRVGLAADETGAGVRQDFHGGNRQRAAGTGKHFRAGARSARPLARHHELCYPTAR